MTESAYAIPVEDLVNSARVPVRAQLEEQPDRRSLGGEASGPILWADGTSGEADGA